jgi:hypothetical protein
VPAYRQAGGEGKGEGEFLIIEEAYMKCNRCFGEMVYEKFYGSQEHFWGWRCILCGEIIDEVILENRQWSRSRK